MSLTEVVKAVLYPDCESGYIVIVDGGLVATNDNFDGVPEDAYVLGAWTRSEKYPPGARSMPLNIVLGEGAPQIIWR